MDDLQLRNLRSKLDKADKLKKSIDNIYKIIDNISIGKCTSIEYEYSGPSVGMCFQLDDIGEGNYTYIQPITAKTLGINSADYDEWFSIPIKNYLLSLKEKLQKDFEDLNI